MISKETMNYKEELRIYSLLNDTNYTTNHGERKDSLVDIVEEIYFFCEKNLNLHQLES